MRNSDPLVSIIMNCHNGEQFLYEAIKSIYSQSYKNWEIIFWDNASTDRSAEIANSFDKRLKYFFNKKKTLLGEARVSAVNKANGKYLAFLDCDDLWDENKLSSQIEIIDSDNEIGVVYCRARIISNQNNKIKYFPPKEKQLIAGKVFKELAKKNFIPFVSLLISREKYYQCGGFPKNFRNSMDYYVLLHMSKKFKFANVDKVLCSYRVHSNNLSKSSQIKLCIEAVESVSIFLPDEEAKTGIQYHYIKLLMAAIKERKIKIFLLYLTKLRSPFVLLELFNLYIKKNKLQ